MLDLNSQSWSLRSETATSHPLLVAVFALEQADEQSESRVNALARVAGFLLSFVVRALSLAPFRIGLYLHCALRFFEYHGESEHDNKRRQPRSVLTTASVQGCLLPLENVFVDLIS